MAKVVYFTRDPRNSGGGKLNFTKFETEHIEDCIGFLKRLVGGKGEGLHRGRKMCVMATGGGSYKFYERMKKELDVDVIQEDEMECLIVGIFHHSPAFQFMETYRLQASIFLFRKYLLRCLLSHPQIK